MHMWGVAVSSLICSLEVPSHCRWQPGATGLKVLAVSRHPTEQQEQPEVPAALPKPAPYLARLEPAQLPAPQAYTNFSNGRGSGEVPCKQQQIGQLRPPDVQQSPPNPAVGSSLPHLAVASVFFPRKSIPTQKAASK